METARAESQLAFQLQVCIWLNNKMFHFVFSLFFPLKNIKIKERIAQVVTFFIIFETRILIMRDQLLVNVIKQRLRDLFIKLRKLRRDRLIQSIFLYICLSILYLSIDLSMYTSIYVSIDEFIP